MKECNQTKDWSTTIHGVVLPKYILYGKIAGIEYTCNPFLYPITVISVWDNRRECFVNRDAKKYPAIIKAVKKYTAENKILGNSIETCKFSQKRAKAEFHREKSRAEIKARKIERAWSEIGRPQEKRPQSEYIFRAYRINGLAGCVESASNTGWEKEVSSVGYNGITSEQNLSNRGYAQNFEMGQTTSGTVDGPYTRSGFEVKKDGCMTLVEASKKAASEKAMNTVHFSGRKWKGDSFQVEKRGSTNSIPPKTVYEQIQEEGEEYFKIVNWRAYQK